MFCLKRNTWIFDIASSLLIKIGTLIALITKHGCFDELKREKRELFKAISISKKH